MRMPSGEELRGVALMAQALGGAQAPRVAVVGGLAVQLYGSPRLTKDVDVVARSLPAGSGEFPQKAPLSFGGFTYGTPAGIDLDWIVRNDEYRALYEDALDAAQPQDDGLLVVPADYLSAMKFATLRPKDYEDLMYLLGEPGLIDLQAARNLVYRFLGGKFASDQFAAAIQEAQWRRAQDQR